MNIIVHGGLVLATGPVYYIAHRESQLVTYQGSSKQLNDHTGKGLEATCCLVSSQTGSNKYTHQMSVTI